MRESFLAREVLTMSNIRLVISIAQKYDKLGVELADLIQVMTSCSCTLLTVCFTRITNAPHKNNTEYVTFWQFDR